MEKTLEQVSIFKYPLQLLHLADNAIGIAESI